MPLDLASRRVLVTGGSGFLGRRVLAALDTPGCREVFAPRRADCNPVDRDASHQLLHGTRPDIVIRPAPVVGGIGANRANLGKFFHDNLAESAVGFRAKTDFFQS